MRIQNWAVALFFVALISFGAAASPDAAVAQAGGGPPLFLAMPDAYPDVDGRVMLLREPGREIVVLSGTATPEDLGVAVRMLARFRRERGQPEQGRGDMIPIVGYVTPPLSPERRSTLASALEELRARPFANVGHLGRGRWMAWDPR